MLRQRRGSAAVGRRQGEDALMNRLVGRGAKRGSTFLGRFGDVAKQPPVWAGVASVLALTGPKGRHAALRGGVNYLTAAAVHLPVKAVVDRRRPARSGGLPKVGRLMSSFPSGHCASELAFALGAAQELPYLFIPLYGATLAAEWSLVRSRSHYPSDVLGGGIIAVVVCMVTWKLWPPQRSRADDGPDKQGLKESVEGSADSAEEKPPSGRKQCRRVLPGESPVDPRAALSKKVQG